MKLTKTFLLTAALLAFGCGDDASPAQDASPTRDANMGLDAESIDASIPDVPNVPDVPAATCTDGIENGTETGVDCGGMCVACVCLTQSEIPAAECEALTEFYRSTNGDDWDTNDDWLVTETPCSWQGLACIDSHIVEIFLPNNGLSGSLPGSLENLTQLQVLNLGQNQIASTLPVSLGTLAPLRTLLLGDNNLVGEIPRELGSLSNLAFLELQNNRFEGELAGELGGLAALTYFGVENNMLTGEIPAELADLDVHHFLLAGNMFTGAIPAWLGDWPLETLDLSGNQLTGPIPSELARPQFLATLNLGGNALTGDFPHELLQMENLRTLDVRENQLTGDLPVWISRRITHLNMSSNRLTGLFPEGLFIYTEMEVMDVSNNQFRGSLNFGPFRASNLVELRAANNLMAGNLSDDIMQFGDSDTLDIDFSNNGCFRTSVRLREWLEERTPGWDTGCSARCVDGLMSGTETAVDCGGLCGPTCATDETCEHDGDCASDNCLFDAERPTCQP